MLLIICFSNFIYANDTAFVKLESSFDGRIGVYALNTANNETVEYRANERFPFCSTVKMLVAAAILKKSETDSNLLPRHINYTQQELNAAGWVPITKQHVNDGMDVAALCAAAIQYSDSGAMNLLVSLLGGVQAVTIFARSLGDKTFRLDRLEPDLNSAIPGDKRDTNTPAAMAKDLQKLVLGNALEPAQRELLSMWLKGSTTGDTRIRAGVPKDWMVGDKTGSGEYGTANDLAIIWPLHCAPIILSIYTTQHQKNQPWNDAIIAEATRIVLNNLAQMDRCLRKELEHAHNPEKENYEKRK